MYYYCTHSLEHKGRSHMPKQFKGVIGRYAAESTPWWQEPVRAKEGAPNVFYIVLHDGGYGQLRCFTGRRASTAGPSDAAWSAFTGSGAATPTSGIPSSSTINNRGSLIRRRRKD